MKIRKTIIGGGFPKICVPILENSTENILRKAKEVAKANPDLIEFRVDYFKEYKKAKDLTKLLEALRKIIGNIPLLLTCRTLNEGGEGNITLAEYKLLYQTAILSGLIDAVDYEIDFIEENGRGLIDYARSKGVRVLLSHHDFKKTPKSAEILETFKRMSELGGDIIKVAYMPKNLEDVEIIRRSGLVASVTYSGTPVIAIAMGELGISSRRDPESFGSSITFAKVGAGSAPGQLDIEAVRAHLK